MTDTQKPTYADLEAEIKHFQTGISQYSDLLAADSRGISKRISKVQPSTLGSMQLILVELKKFLTLIPSHCTKLGIVFKWPIPERNLNAAKTQLKECFAVYTLLMSLLSQFFNQFKERTSFLFRKYIALNLAELFDLNLLLVKEFEQILLHSLENKYPDTKRLVIIGKIWSKCEAISAGLRLTHVDTNPGKINLEFVELLLLKNELSSNLDILNDGLVDLEDWMQNPGSNDGFDEDDPFGLDDDLSEDDYEVAQLNKKMNNAGLDKEQESHLSEKIEFANRYVSKIKMVKLLYSMIIKTISKKNDTCCIGVTAAELDTIYKLQIDIVSLIDELISLICFVKAFSKSDVLDTYKELQQSCFQLNLLGFKKLIDLEERNAKKDILADSWEKKFME